MSVCYKAFGHPIPEGLETLNDTVSEGWLLTTIECGLMEDILGPLRTHIVAFLTAFLF